MTRITLMIQARGRWVKPSAMPIACTQIFERAGPFSLDALSNLRARDRLAAFGRRGPVVNVLPRIREIGAISG